MEEIGGSDRSANQIRDELTRGLRSLHGLYVRVVQLTKRKNVLVDSWKENKWAMYSTI